VFHISIWGDKLPVATGLMSMMWPSRIDQVTNLLSQDLIDSKRSWVTRFLEPLRVIGLQARVMFFTTKWCPANHKMTANKLQNSAQRAGKWCQMLLQHFCYQITLSSLWWKQFLAFISLSVNSTSST